MLDGAAWTAALPRWCVAMHEPMAELNALDGRFGERRSWCHARQMRHAGETGAAQHARQAGTRVQACAQATAQASGSSFGTLLTVALMTSAKRCAGATSLDAPSLQPC